MRRKRLEPLTFKKKKNRKIESKIRKKKKKFNSTKREGKDLIASSSRFGENVGVDLSGLSWGVSFRRHGFFSAAKQREENGKGNLL